jgi:glycosyltransferase involved in cell wall biosynthesis
MAQAKSIHSRQVKQPSVSIIVPMYNNAKVIGRCVRALNKLDYPGQKIEVFLSDDCSPDNSIDLAEKLIDRKKFKRVESIRPKREGGVSRTRNRALGLVSGDFVAFIDGDMVVPKNFLKKTLKHFEDEKVGGVAIGCPFEDKNLITDYYDSFERAQKLVWNAEIGTGATLYRGQAIKGLRFDERIFLPSYEDADFALTVMEKGFKTLYDPSLEALHLRSTNLKKEMTVLFRKGVDIPLVLNKRAARKKRLNRTLTMNSAFVLSVIVFPLFPFLCLYYFLRHFKALKENRFQNAVIGLLLDLSRSAGLVKGRLKWLKR